MQTAKVHSLTLWFLPKDLVVNKFRSKPFDFSFSPSESIHLDTILPSNRAVQVHGVIAQRPPSLLEMSGLEVLGGVAASLQLLDVALKISQKASNFVKSLKNHQKDVQRLRHELEETEAHINGLKQVLNQSQTSPEFRTHYAVLLDTIQKIANAYHDDMRILNDFLPTTQEVPWHDKIKFIRSKDSIQDLIKRLEQRKSSASLALATIGRVVDISHHQTMKEVKNELQSIGREQQGTSDRATQQYNTLVSQFQTAHESTSDVLSSHTQNLNAIQASIRTGNKNTAKILQRLERQVRQQRLGNSSQVVTSLSQELSTTIDGPELANIVGLAVRAELKGLKEQELHDSRFKHSQEVVEGVVSAISHEVHSHELAGLSSFNCAKLHNRDPSKQVSRSCEIPIMAQLPPLPAEHSVHCNISSSTVTLYQSDNDFTTNFGALHIHLRKFRVKARLQMRSEVYFLLRIIFMPRAWLCSRGFKLSYSSMPHADGYYEICPRIMPVRIIQNGSELCWWRLLNNDDVDTIKRLIWMGQYTPYDVSEHGGNILEDAFHHGAWKIVKHLLVDSGHGKVLLDGTRHFRLSISVIPTSEALANEYVNEMKQAFHLLDQMRTSFSLELVRLAAANFLSLHFANIVWNTSLKMKCDLYVLLQTYGAGSEVFLCLTTSFYSSSSIFIHSLTLYLACCEDLNKQDLPISTTEVGANIHAQTGRVCLLAYILCQWGSYKRRVGRRLWGQRLPHFFRVVSLVIGEGVDIYQLQEIRRSEFVTIDELATLLDVEEEWRVVLSQCELNPREVYAKSKLEQVEHWRLRGSKRTGVDEAMLDRPSTGMRYRGQFEQKQPDQSLIRPWLLWGETICHEKRRKII